MRALQRNNVHITGSGPTTLMFSHGFGCDQSMWRLLAPTLGERFKTVLFDLTGSGKSDLGAYDHRKHGSLQGHADDVIEIIEATASGRVVFVGHSVSSMIGMLAGITAPSLFSSQVMIGPSPCYIDDGDYIGGFVQADIDGLLHTLDSNYLGWASHMAPAIMGAPDQPELGVELTNSFCRTDPEIAKHFARVTFTSDHRADVPRHILPTLILQSSEDFIAPLAVGRYLHARWPQSTLCTVDNIGHCPHLSAPGDCARAISAFIKGVEA